MMGWAVAFVLFVIMVLAQWQLFAIRKNLDKMVELQRRQLGELPAPAPTVKPAEYRRICDPV